MKQTIEQTTEELFRIYKTILELADECRKNEHLVNFRDEVEQHLINFEEWYPEVVAEYHFINSVNKQS